MKKRLFILMILCFNFLFLSFNSCYAQWQQTNGPYGGAVSCFAIKGDTIFAGTNGGEVFLSTNNGESWADVSNGLNVDWVAALAIVGENIFAGTSDGVYLSSDNGARWNAVNNGLTKTCVGSLAISGGNIFAGTYGEGVFLSTDNGVSWNAMNNGLPSDTNGYYWIEALAISGGNIFAGTNNPYGGESGIFLSTDNGGSWVAMNTGLTNTNIWSLAISGANILAGTNGGGVFLSTNRGTSWVAVNTGLLSSFVLSFAISGANILAGTNGGGVFLSTNRGASWSAVNNGLTNTYVYALAISGNNIFAGTWGGGVFLSSNNGSSWAAVDTGLTTVVTALAISGNNIFAGTGYSSSSGGVYLSSNNGSSWATVNTGLIDNFVWALAISGNNIFTGTQGGGLFLSSNNGSSWAAVNTGLTNTDVYALAISGNNIFAGTYGGGVFLSSNNGSSWAAVNTGLTNTDVYALAISGDSIFAGTWGGGVFLSSNNGSSWDTVNTGLTDNFVWALAISGNNIFAGTWGGVFLSSNNGSSWNAMNTGLTNYTIDDLAISGNNIFAGTWGGGVFLSSNNGSSWVAVNTGLTNYDVNALAISKDTIYAGTNEGVWKLALCTRAPIAADTGTNTPSQNQIIWNWTSVAGATGYKWNNINDYRTATDIGTDTSYTESGLTCNTSYTLYVWAYNGCGYSTATSLTQKTTVCSSGLNLWGMTEEGGANGEGIIFSYNPGTGTYIDKLDFAGTSNGANPNGSLMQASDGNLYGMTRGGGAYGEGVIFEYNPGTSTFTKLIDFTGTSNGSEPIGSLIQASDGNLYGMTTWGGANEDGVMFKYNPDSSIYTKLIDFVGTTNGTSPAGSLMQATNGNLYGMTYSGGANGVGVIFSYNLSNNTITKLIDFAGASNGANPLGSLIQASDGNLYGMTWQGGANDDGVIFSYNLSSNTITKLIDFARTSNGRVPLGSLMQASDGNLYGMNNVGGAFNSGVIFSYNLSSNTFTKVIDFAWMSGGSPYDESLMQASDGNLYGMTQNGGAHEYGVIFEYNLTTSTYTDNINFTDTAGTYPGAYPTSLTEVCTPVLAITGNSAVCSGSTGVVYTTATIMTNYKWAVSSGGTITAGQGTNSVTVTWDTAGTQFISVLYERYSTLCGSAISPIVYNVRVNALQLSAPKQSTITASPTQIVWNWTSVAAATGYKWNTTNDYSTATDIGIDTSYTETGLTCNTSYTLYVWAYNGCGNSTATNLYQKTTVCSTGPSLWGMTRDGGAYGDGVIFEYNPGTGTYTDKLDFDSTNTGKWPEGSLMQASDGNLYGMTVEGGANNFGVIFSYNPGTSTYTKLIDFDGTNGRWSSGSLMQASDGNLYGMTWEGGAYGGGVIFSYNFSNNTFTKLIDFAVSGASPNGSLMQASDGNLYGMMEGGGAYGYGVMFKYNPGTSTYTKLIDFDSTNTGKWPLQSLIQASDGNLYGMIEEGGANNDGVMFSYNLRSNTFTKLIDFAGTSNDANPFGSLIQASDGNLYGMTEFGGANGEGVIFSYNPITSTFTKLIDFAGDIGAYPLGTLIQASDGNLYGMTSNGGANKDGVIFSYNISTSTYTDNINFTGTGTYAGAYPFFTALTEVCTPVPAITGNSAVCSGSTGNVYTTATGMTNYTWTVSSGGSITAGQGTNTVTVTWDTAGTQTISVLYERYSTLCGSAVSPIVYNVRVNKCSACPVIITQPQPSTVCEGTNATFSVLTHNSASTFQWLFSTDSGTTYNSVGTNDSILKISSVTLSMNGYLYECVVNNTVGTCPTTSTSVTLTVNSVNVNITPSLTQYTNTSVILTANSTSTILSYQWYEDGLGLGLGLIDTINAIPIHSYYVIATSSQGCIKKSNTIQVLLPSCPHIITQPQPSTVCKNSNASFSISTENHSSLTFQWIFSIDGGTSYNFIGTNDSILKLTSVTLSMNGNIYECIVTNAGGCALTSNPAILTVNSANVNITPSLTQYTTTSVTLTANSTSNISSYQWYKDGVSLGITGTNATCNASPIHYYYVKATSDQGCIKKSNTVQVLLPSCPHIITQPQALAACDGSDASFSISTVSSATLTYQWLVSTDSGTTYNQVPSGTDSSLTVAVVPAMNGDFYECIITNAGGCPLTSNQATLTVSLPTATISGTTSVCQNAASPNITFTGAGGTAPYTFTYTVNGKQLTVISNQNTNTAEVAVPTGTVGGYVYSLVSVSDNNGCSQAQSGSATVTVNKCSGGCPYIYSQPQSSMVCGNANIAFNISTSNSSSLTFQWLVSKDGGKTYTSVGGGGTDSSLTVAAISAMNGYIYECIVNNSSGTCPTTSTPATLTVNSYPNAPIVISPVKYCQNDTATTLSATGSNLLWYIIATGGTGSATAPTPSTAKSDTISYYVLQTINGCESPRAQIMVITYSLPVTPTISQKGNNLVSSSANDNQWYDQNGIINGATDSIFVITKGGKYYVIITKNGCQSDASNIISITGINELRITNYELRIYPNPGNSFIVVSYQLIENSPVNINIYDITGRCVEGFYAQQRGKGEQDVKINTQKLEEGVYILKFSTTNFIGTKKIIVWH